MNVPEFKATDLSSSYSLTKFVACGPQALGNFITPCTEQPCNCCIEVTCLVTGSRWLRSARDVALRDNCPSAVLVNVDEIALLVVTAVRKSSRRDAVDILDVQRDLKGEQK